MPASPNSLPLEMQEAVDNALEGERLMTPRPMDEEGGDALDDDDEGKAEEYYIQKGHLLRLVPRLEDTSKKNTSTLFTVRLNTFHAGDEIEAWGPVTLYEAQRRTIDHYPRCAGFSYNQKKQMAFFHHSIDGGKIRHEGNKHRTGIPVEDFNLYLRIPDPFYKQ